MSYKLSCENYYEDDKYYWFSAMQWNGFYRVDKHTLTPEFLFSFPDEPLSQSRLYPHITKVDDWFVFAPVRGNHVVIYHEKSKEILSFPLKVCFENRTLQYNKRSKFSSVVSYEDNVYLFPSTYPSIVKLNLSTKTLTYLDDGIMQIEQLLPTSRNKVLKLYFGIGESKDNKVYLPIGCTNHVGIFHLDQDKLELHKIEGEIIAFHTLFFHEQDCFLTPRIGTELTAWNETTKESRTFSFLNTEQEQKERTAASVTFVHSNNLWNPSTQSSLYQLDRASGRIEKLSFIEEILPKHHEFPQISFIDMFCAKSHGDVFSFICGKNHDWYEVNLVTKEYSIKTIPADEVGQKVLSEKKEFYNESITADLDSYLEYLKTRQVPQEKNHRVETIGEIIFKATVPPL